MRALGKKPSHFDDIELDRRQGLHLAAVVEQLVARMGGTNTLAAEQIKGVSSGTLSRLRRPRPTSRFAPATLDAIAKAARVTRTELLAGKGLQ